MSQNIENTKFQCYSLFVLKNKRRINMIDNEQLNLLFSHTENENDYEEEKRKKKQKLVRNEFEKSGKYGMPLIKKQKIDLDKIELLSYLKLKTMIQKTKIKQYISSLMIGILKQYMRSLNKHLKN